MMGVNYYFQPGGIPFRVLAAKMLGFGDAKIDLSKKI